MKILLLGGPKFLGRAYIDEALSRGHEVTTFNRGLSGTDQSLDAQLDSLAEAEVT